MTEKPFFGQSTLASGLLDLIHMEVCGPLNTPARGGYSYFITFTDDHSQYGYVYLMRYKSEAFGRFKEYTLEIVNQTGRKIKTLRSDRGEEYLSGEFTDYLKENGYALETAVKLLNMAPSKTVSQTPYEIWHVKPASYKYLRVWGSPTYVKRLVGDKLDSRSSLYSVPVLRRSTRESQPPERYGFLGLTSKKDNDPRTYEEAMSDINSDKWLEATRSGINSMGSNQF
ncbi:UNVERIFIED_CONTAM: hypothetical protein Slati_0203600 [Sesamum latifolium]|uniref:Integrase catalytic domain-containing protein n=1 Tax=Sesamum latifolium TaxID=2727402 RepID=A0AAW2YBS9_9LAMI